jgi:pyridoxine 5-phosphate synthase
MHLPLHHATPRPMTQLSVNVNKLATLRNSRGKNLPNVLAFSEKILTLGAFGITVHPRPDERHIRLSDVYALKELLSTWQKKGAQVEFNVEGFPSPDFLKLMDKVRPDQCTLVPDPPEALTSNAGWDLQKNEAFLTPIVAALSKFTRVSLFVEPARFTEPQRAALERIHPQRIELYTEAYTDAFATPLEAQVLATYKSAASQAKALKIGVNAGHDLNQQNLGPLLKAIPWISEVSIGHALFCEALEQGLTHTIRHYQAILARV